MTVQCGTFSNDWKKYMQGQIEPGPVSNGFDMGKATEIKKERIHNMNRWT